MAPADAADATRALALTPAGTQARPRVVALAAPRDATLATAASCPVIATIAESSLDPNPLHITNTSGFVVSSLGLAVLQHGDAQLIRGLLDRGVDPNGPDDEVDAPLIVAAARGLGELAALLIAHGADVNIRTRETTSTLVSSPADTSLRQLDGWTPLHFAARGAQVELINMLVGAGADVDAESAALERPLDLAVRSGDLRTVECLLDHGAALNSAARPTMLFVAVSHGYHEIADRLLRDRPDWLSEPRLLHRAAAEGHIEMVRLLLKRGVSVESIVRHGSTRILFKRRADSIELFSMLVPLGLTPNVLLVDQRPRLGTVLISLLELALEAHHEPFLRLLLRHGADPNDAQATTMHRAAELASFGEMRLLLAHGGDLYREDKSRTTPLHALVGSRRLEMLQALIRWGVVRDLTLPASATSLLSAACARGCEDMVEFLLIETPRLSSQSADPSTESAPIDVNSRTGINGETPLHMAVRSGNRRLVRRLLELGADPAIPSSTGRTPLYAACEGGDESMLELLLALPGASVHIRDNTGTTLLHAAAQFGHTTIVHRLLDLGVAVDTVDVEGSTALMCAMETAETDALQLLLEHGASMAFDGNGNHPIHYAAISNDYAAMELLLGHGAPVDCVHHEGLSPLHLAAQTSATETINVLLSHGAPVDQVTNVDGLSPLHVAVRMRAAGAVEQLLANGADVNLRDVDGRTPLAMALDERVRSSLCSWWCRIATFRCLDTDTNFNRKIPSNRV